MDETTQNAGTPTQEETPEAQLATESQAVNEPFAAFPLELRQTAEVLKSGKTPPPVTVRKLLSWFQAQRRGSFIVIYINHVLKTLGIATDPDFNAVWIDSEISFVVAPPEAPESDLSRPDAASRGDGAGAADIEVAESAHAAVVVEGAVDDPTYRIGKLDAANKRVISVAPNQAIELAITQMLAYSFSQLPVMQGDREVKGVLTWESIGTNLAFGNTGKEVRDFMTSAQMISSEKSLFDAIEIIAHYNYVLVQAPDRRISGIVTSADLSRQFQQLTEPFLLLSEIEQHIRKLIVGKFTQDELAFASDPADTERTITNVADLTMGEYIRLLENPENWSKLKLQIDRSVFIEELKAVGRIRNDIMHFDPDPLGPSDLARLRQFVVFAQSLRELGAF
jgi:predicted transcriptional regulator